MILMSTAVIAPVNPMSAEGKDTVMSVMRRDRANFIRLVSDPKNWNVQTRCTEWETRDLVGHMIDVLEGYFKNFDADRNGGENTALGRSGEGRDVERPRERLPQAFTRRGDRTLQERC